MQITIEITADELFRLKSHLVQKITLAKAGMAVSGLPELILVRVLLASEQDGPENSVKSKKDIYKE